MIKVEIMYRVSMYGTDWMMTEEEYKEFRENALNLPLAIIYPRVESIKPIDFISDVDAIDYSAPWWQPNPHRQEKKDQAEDCPDYIEPPELREEKAPEVICENGACRLVLEEETNDEPLKTEEKANDNAKDFTPYIKMFREKENSRTIQKRMMEDFGITEGTASTYYYSKVKKPAEKEIEVEKKTLKNKPEGKVQIIPPVAYEKPADGKYFNDEDRIRLQRIVGIK